MPTDLEKQLAGFLAQVPRAEIDAIIDLVARRHGMSIDVLRGKSRSAPLVRIRQLAMSEARDAGYSLPEIGRALNRDHTTVLHGIRRHRRKR
jgi:chromosomal replication initiation ATPase DnaA